MLLPCDAAGDGLRFLAVVSCLSSPNHSPRCTRMTAEDQWMIEYVNTINSSQGDAEIQRQRRTCI